jgi:RNA-directed DNA polymerase
LGIPTVKDRVVQGALKRVLEPIFEREFLDCSYGFRPGRSAKDALRQVSELLNAGYTWVVDADISSYFDSINHDRLLREVKRHVSDGRVLTLIRRYLEQDILEGAERWTPTRGTPQGAVLSPLLANIYLHPLDVRLSERYAMVRYADDLVVLCQSQEAAQAALEEIQSHCLAYQLELHPEKTHVGDCRLPGQGFEFLGYRFEAGRRWVRNKSQSAIRDRIRAQTKRTRGDSLGRIIEDLNPILRGWFGYFKHAHRHEFRNLDAFTRRRLRALLRKQHKRPGRGHTHADHQQWPNTFFAQLGLFTCHQAYVLARQSR